MRRLLLSLAAAALVVTAPTIASARDTIPNAAAATTLTRPMEVYGVWHCGDDACIWGTVRDVAEFDAENHWIIDRGDGRPSVNLVVLSFIEPRKLLHRTDDAATVDGVPRGITPEIVDYFTSHGVRVMISIGGITYVDVWNEALAEDAAGLGQRAAQVAADLGVGIEIDYEENSGADLAGLQSFIDAYRSVHPYDATGADPAARLTIDLAAGDRWLIDIAQKATADWLRTDTPVLDYANAMVPARQPHNAGSAIDNWQEHVDGKPQYSPPIPPLAPAKMAVSLYIAEGKQVRAECNDFTASLQNSTGDWVETATPNGAGTSAGVLGYMFWAAERPSTRGVTTQPPNTCEGGVGAGATAYQVVIPMPALRQS